MAVVEIAAHSTTLRVGLLRSSQLQGGGKGDLRFGVVGDLA